MTSDDAELEARADALRRIVYGTPEGFASGAADELESVEAELARHADERERARAATAAAARAEAGGPDERRPGEASARPDAGTEPAADGGDATAAGVVARAAMEDAPETGHPVASATGTRRPGRLGTRVASGLAIAAVLAGFAVTGAIAVISVATPPRGLAVFDRPQEHDDENLTVALGAQADTVRRIDEVLGRGFWAYLNGIDQVCLSVVPVGTSLVERGECASRERFEEHGIMVQYAATELGPHRPDGMGERDVVVISWSAESEGVTWELVLIDPPASDRMTYEEWSNRPVAR
ncbi:hypothetical protein ACFVTX_06475 [Agromyces sp. NPDC058136]|uniref:hypothetical protein n=1 Tax=Agromyces sp. NPDC058136 TaxID=3346354 RepID=UPI0036D98F12